MILRPEQVKLLAMGLPGTPANIGSKSSNSTASTNTSNTYSTNTTTNSTYNTTDTTTQDRRLVTDHGIGISADASTITTSNSNNQSDSHNTDNSIFYQVSRPMAARSRRQPIWRKRRSTTARPSPCTSCRRRKC
jgi:hypothetical protein